MTNQAGKPFYFVNSERFSGTSFKRSPPEGSVVIVPYCVPPRDVYVIISYARVNSHTPVACRSRESRKKPGESREVTHWVLFVGLFDDLSAAWLYTTLNSLMYCEIDIIQARRYLLQFSHIASIRDASFSEF